MGHQFSPCTAVGVISDEAPAAPYRCRQEPLQDMVAGLVVVPGSVVYCGPDLPVEPTCTPVKRAHYRSGLAVAGPDRRDTRQLSDRITVRDRDVLGERAPSCRSGHVGSS